MFFLRAKVSYNNFYLVVHNNRFTFEDFEPNWAAFFNYPGMYPNYGHQFDSVNAAIDTTVHHNSTFEMRCSIGGQYNVYQWTKDGVDIPFATDSILVLNNVALSDSGVYACRITNTMVTTLTYYRRSITLRVDKETALPTSSKAIVNEMLLYPSPAYNHLNIVVKLKETSPAIIEMYDIYGNKIKTIANTTIEEAVFTVNVSHLAKGAYIVRLTSNGFTSSQRFLIIK